jgi:hypothetical protein
MSPVIGAATEGPIHADLHIHSRPVKRTQPLEFAPAETQGKRRFTPLLVVL